jgi:hypothetical protein
VVNYQDSALPFQAGGKVETPRENGRDSAASPKGSKLNLMVQVVTIVAALGALVISLLTYNDAAKAEESAALIRSQTLQIERLRVLDDRLLDMERQNPKLLCLYDIYDPKTLGCKPEDMQLSPKTIGYAEIVTDFLGLASFYQEEWCIEPEDLTISASMETSENAGYWGNYNPAPQERQKALKDYAEVLNDCDLYKEFYRTVRTSPNGVLRAVQKAKKAAAERPLTNVK